ncbi:alpha/beta fold hydrolase [Thauera linaloolentis]|uniref:Proline iminopeptidase n=1 Tax=Thauera linaloolentis (strain DSM 12138 / JCM 21573 / CCUG 41526 / CIP 105981 / IAM 15112 / NBRC 102519 / 47Lol) TaxID=1123367 RepID=N6Y7M8_THAL4|nr:alpha/beta fold hydrolase [Thauera linaloolentis]ENO87580.1 proline iminopeptidase [Thauera linaloolentis 47Lol = DSM 12138]MCM8564164.1 alpha/beta fold hydrolase [Thauera linaloolentis]
MAAMQAAPATPLDIRDPWQQGWLDVGDGHAIRFEQCGNRAGTPLLFLHGGPGSGCSARHRTLFDATRFRIVLFDQRGCGRSTPRGALAANTTPDLVADIERLRRHLGIARWLVSGGSWGSTLALAYCAHHRQACLGAVLRGIFLARREDIDGFFDGAAASQQAEHARLAARVPGSGRLAERIFAAVLGDDRTHALDVVRHWMQWEESLTRGRPTPLPWLDAAGEARALDKYRVQAHYLRHDCFMAAGEWQARAESLAGLPVSLLHGRKDAVCRPEGALALHRHLPGSRLTWVEDAGHDPFEPAMRAALRDACAAFG